MNHKINYHKFALISSYIPFHGIDIYGRPDYGNKSSSMIEIAV